MEFKSKLFNWPGKGNHLIIIARGVMDRMAFRRLFEEIETATEDLIECKVSVDLSDSTYEIHRTEIQAFVAALRFDRWPERQKITLVSAPGLSDSQRLYYLRNQLVARGFMVEVVRGLEI